MTSRKHGEPGQEVPFEVDALASRVQALEIELQALSKQYEEALSYIAELEERQKEVEDQRQLLEQANVRTALLVEEVETREQRYREQAESLARTTAELNEAHRRLASTYDALRADRARQERMLREMEVELEAAGTVQRLLLPQACPGEVPGLELAMCYLPASEASGDWFGFCQDPEQRELTILIGDATGHGLGAALLTAGAFSSVATIHALDAALQALQAGDPEAAPAAMSMRHFLRERMEPSSLLALLSAVIGRMGKRQLAMTLFAATYNVKERSMRFANAGHPLPILVREKEDTGGGRVSARSLVARGDQLGLTQPEAGLKRAQRSVELAKNDLVLFYTDGLMESRNSHKRVIGVRRIVRWLRELHDRPIDAIRDALRIRVEEHLEDTRAEDDITFVLARITE